MWMANILSETPGQICFRTSPEMKLNKVQNSFLIIYEIIECWRAQEVCLCLWCSVSGWSKITAIGDISSKLFCCFSKQTKIYIGTLRKHGFWSFTGAKQMYCNGRYQKGHLKKCLFINGWDGMCVCRPVLKKGWLTFDGIFRFWLTEGPCTFLKGSPKLSEILQKNH